MGEKIFDADIFNPFTRYNINIRDILPKAITKLQVCLSKKSYETYVEVGNDKTYDVYAEYLSAVDALPVEMQDKMNYDPQAVVLDINGRFIRGVECKLGLYINDKTIVERTFYVDGFNPMSRYSVDLNEAIVDIADIVYEQIKKSDIKNMWDDYDLINIKGLSINQIRELSPAKRDEMLRRLRHN